MKKARPKTRGTFLFGPFAQGNYTSKGDVDILIVYPDLEISFFLASRILPTSSAKFLWT